MSTAAAPTQSHRSRPGEECLLSVKAPAPPAQGPGCGRRWRAVPRLGPDATATGLGRLDTLRPNRPDPVGASRAASLRDRASSTLDPPTGVLVMA